MSWPLALTVLVALGAGWLLLRPAFAKALSDMPPKRRGLVVAGTLVAVGIALFGLRLAPFGLVAFVLAGGAAMRGFTAEAPQTRRTEDRSPSTPMTNAEALSVLGLKPGADRAAIDAAHKRMIVKAHPDSGGSDYLAAKVNEAREVLRR